MGYLTISTILRILTAGLLLFALTNQPYDYFTILRIVTCVTSAYLIYVASITKKSFWIVVFVFVIILFNPIIKFPIKRETWSIIDIITAIIMLGSIFFLKEDKTINDLLGPEDVGYGNIVEKVMTEGQNALTQRMLDDPEFARKTLADLQNIEAGKTDAENKANAKT